MNKCEHGEPITLFCLSEECDYKDLCGCKMCFKRFHRHGQNLDTLELEKLEELFRCFCVRSDVKMKSNLLQEAVENYFTIMKSQISASIDAVSRIIANKLKYPYLYSQDQLDTFRKIKNKQYKKINKKELSTFYTFANSINKDVIESNQSKMYLQEIATLQETMKNINQAFLMYSKAVQKLDSSFNMNQSFLDKIFEISASIQAKQDHKQRKLSNESYNIRHTNQNTSNKDFHDELLKEKCRQNINTIQNYSSVRDRRVSLDGSGLKYGNLQAEKSKIEANEKQISEKKKKLFDMMKYPPVGSQKLKQISISREKEKRNASKSIEKQIFKNLGIKNQQNHPYLAELPLTIHQHEDEYNINSPKKVRAGLQFHEIKKSQELDKETAKFFDDLISKGINLPQMIVHTLLPRQQSKRKLYEDKRDVKEKKITISVKKFGKEQQIFSPLLRKKNEVVAEKQNNEQEDGKIYLFGNKNQTNIFKQGKNTLFRNQKQEQKLLLKDKQADSLALLVQSLPLPPQKAIPILEAALKYAHNNLSAAEYLSYLYLQIQKPKQCLELCNKILEQLEDSPQANQLSIHISNNKAAALNMLGRYSQSISILQNCLAYSKRDIYYKNLGDAYFCLAIYEKATFNYQNALKINNRMQQALYNLSVCYFIQEHLPQAKQKILIALKMSSKNQQYIRLHKQILTKMQI